LIEIWGPGTAVRKIAKGSRGNLRVDMGLACLSNGRLERRPA